MEEGGDKPKATPKPKANKKAAEAGKAKKGGDGDGGTPAPKRQKAAEPKAAKTAAADDEPAQPQEAFSMKGQLVRDLAVMMYGFGDDVAPLPETLDLVEDIVLDYAGTLMRKAMDSAAQRGKLRKPQQPGAGTAVGAEDVLFLVRKDPKKYARAKELLIMDEEIRKARQVVEDEEFAREQSPYLLQHAHNPVEWYPWGEEAFEKARREDKPIFLSVGYSTCHWCHVMERESFESEEVAALMNELFVNVKVDREERPDVDKVYMTYVQATQGGGGWPMSCFLTPSLEPFFGGTYFPPSDGFGRPGFKTVLRRIAQVWQEKKEDIRSSSKSSMAKLAEVLAPEPSAEALTAQEQGRAIDLCASQLSSRFDAKLGGFGGAPKFPRPAEINLLLHQHARLAAAGQADAAAKVLEMATFTLQRMAAGGMRDQLGGGFHRYSVDEHWHVPHFEIMLYDNPQLVSTYLAAFQITGDPQYATVARGVLDYLMRDMTHPEGGLFAAEDADSLDPASGKKKEGWFYVWTQQEIQDVLGPDDAAIFSRHYYVKPAGNTDLSPRSDPHDEFGGLNVLIQRQTLAETAKAAGKSEADTAALLASCREKLFNVRAKRPRPHRDEKIVSAWQGMSISAFATAARVLPHEQPPAAREFPVEGRDPKQYLQAALKIAAFVRQHLYDAPTRQLRRAYTDGPSSVPGFADDYAYMISGLLDLYSTTGDIAHLQWALELQGTMQELFWDPAAGAYYNNKEGDASILLRMKEDYDGAEPAASSIALANLWRLAGLTSGEEAEQWREKAALCAAAFGDRLAEAAIALPQMACGLYLLTLGYPRQVVISGKRGAADTESLVEAAFRPFAPDKLVIQLDHSDAALMDFWRATNPAAVAVAEGKPGGGATAYVCQDFTCKAPTSDPAKVAQLLAEPRGSGAKPMPTSLPGQEPAS
ncbi:spermatogenesis-associated 20 [Chlorella sorokiniana]|uniref:Spermatogenesis-associated 20 n=1 Tax=Chlorella sorokiniana TaxID=3076 RepID=A0A2P6TLH9_CHLSO|nr:spermatogenesis-associated 20 [Chlorella sorokiniana]|eukprot:PRW45152.1 spermatogenesis-associated 20 [Chlorella sorokiniana]